MVAVSVRTQRSACLLACVVLCDAASLPLLWFRARLSCRRCCEARVPPVPCPLVGRHVPTCGVPGHGVGHARKADRAQRALVRRVVACSAGVVVHCGVHVRDTSSLFVVLPLSTLD